MVYSLVSCDAWFSCYLLHQLWIATLWLYCSNYFVTRESQYISGAVNNKKTTHYKKLSKKDSKQYTICYLPMVTVYFVTGHGLMCLVGKEKLRTAPSIQMEQPHIFSRLSPFNMKGHSGRLQLHLDFLPSHCSICIRFTGIVI